MQQLEHMQTFIRVVEAGSFSKAADQMNLARSAVSRRINELEAHLGVRLMNRTTRRFNLTETGQEYLERARHLLNELIEVEQAVRGAHASLKGLLKIACPRHFAHLHMGPVIHEFLDLHPELDLELDVDDRKVNLVESGLDMGIRMGSPGPDSLIARRFAPVRLTICAAPDYLDQHGHPKDLDDLETNHFGLFNTNVVASIAWRFDLADGSERVAVPRARLRANDSEILLEAAIAGYGIITGPTFMMERAVRQGRLVSIMNKFPRPVRGAYAIWPEGRRLNEKARVFIDFLIQKFGDNPYWDEPFNE